MSDWKVFNDTLELGIKASALSLNEDEWMWLIACLKAAQEAHDKTK